MKSSYTRLAFSSLIPMAIASAVLVACGGGSSVSTITSTFSGTAAIGAPIADGTVTVIDATGSTVGTATTGADGSYTLDFNPNNFTAPFVIKVVGSVGDAEETLVSVQPTASTSVINITPITNAISALMSSTGNPLDLLTTAAERSNITSTSVGNAESGFRAALIDNLNAIGLNSNSVNLLNSTFSTALDKLLDNVHVEVTTSGQIKMSTSAGGAVDDLGDSAGTPAAALVVELPKGTIPSAANVGNNLPAPTHPIGIDVLEQARVALNGCFAVAAADRPTAVACTNLVSTDYLNAGRTATQEFATLLDDSGNDLMVFQKPEILRQISTTADNEKLLIRLNAKRSDGQFRSITTVAENNHTASSGWQLVGDQRIFDTLINGVAVKRISINTPANNRYETGFNIFIKKPIQTGLTGTAATNAGATARSKIKQVVVRGEGLPGGLTGSGITLKPKAGCDFLAIMKSDNSIPYCASLYRLRSLLTDGVTSFSPSAAISYMYDTKTDANIEAIKPLDLYKFTIEYYTNTTDDTTSTITYWNRLRSRPLTVAEMGQVRFTDFTDATKAKLTTATLWAGGSDLTLSWTVPENAPSPFTAYFLHAAGSDNVLVSPATRTARIRCAGNLDCSGGTGSYNSSLVTTGQYIFQVVSRNRFDTQIFTQITQ